MSLRYVDECIQEQLAQIIETRSYLNSAFDLFKQKETLLPVECKQTLSLLEKLGKRVQELCAWLNETEPLPSAYKILRYRLTSALYLVDEQVDETSDLIYGFRTICMSSSSSNRTQRRKIASALEKLLSSLDTVTQRAGSLNYEAHRLQKQLEYEEEPYVDDDTQNTNNQRNLWVVK